MESIPQKKRSIGLSAEFCTDKEIGLLREADSMRQIAFFTVFVSTIACLIGIVAVPMTYGYLQRVQSLLQVSLYF